MDVAGWFDKVGVIGNGVLAVIGVFVALGFKKWGLPVVIKAGRSVAGVFRGIGALAELPQYMPSIQRLANIEQTVAKIYKEVMPNGGSSLRDAVSRTEIGLAVAINTTRAQWNGQGMFAVAESDPHGHLIWANSTYLKWVNRIEREVRGTGWINSVGVADRERVRREWDSCVADVRDFCMEFKMRHSSGTEFNVLATATPVTDGIGGPVVKWVSVIQQRNAAGVSVCAV